MQGTMKRIGALVLALAMLVAFMPALGLENAHAEEAEGIQVYMTISNAGVIAAQKDGNAMSWVPVKVTDKNSDSKYTYDEALVAAHEQYFEGGAEGFACADSGWVSKLWGVENNPASYSFMCNGAATGLVTEAEVKENDNLSASINQDAVYYSDWATSFDTTFTKLEAGKDLELTLTGFGAMTADDPVPVKGVQIGYWKEGALEPLEGIVTDENGKATVSFKDPGVYVVSAQGTVKAEVMDWSAGKMVENDCPIIPPCCVVIVEESQPAGSINVDVTINNKGMFPAGKDGAPMLTQNVLAEDADKDGKITVDEVLKAAHEAYFEGGADGYAVEQGAYGPMVTKLWGVETSNTLFFVNKKSLASNVCDEIMENGDSLYASVNQDDVYYSDVYCEFDVMKRGAEKGEKVDLTLSSLYSMANVPEKLAGVQVGIWCAGEFQPIEGAVTDENGKVTVSFDEPGHYIVTAKGAVKGKAYDYSGWPDVKEVETDCPLMAPYAVISVLYDEDDIAKEKIKVAEAEEELKIANEKIAVLEKQVQKVKAKAGKKKATVSWKKLGSGYKYEVYQATKVNGKFKKVATTGKAKATVKKLKSKKTYFFKVRGFKTIDGEKVYTQFSDTVSAKIK